MILSFIKSGFNLSLINDNFSRIVTAMNSQVFYRSPPAGQSNQMETDMDMNGMRIYNLGKPVGASDPARMQDLIDVVAGGAFASQISVDTSIGIAGPNIQTALDSLFLSLSSVIQSMSGVQLRLGVTEALANSLNARVTAIETSPSPATLFTANVNNTGRFGLDNKTGMMIYDSPNSVGAVGDDGALRVVSNILYSTGNGADVSATIQSLRTIIGSPTNNQRGIWSELTSFASGVGQMSATYSHILKRGNSASYGLVARVDDYTDTSVASPTVAQGAMVVVRGTGADVNEWRRGVTVNFGKTPGASGAVGGGKGLYITADADVTVGNAVHNSAPVRSNVFLNSGATASVDGSVMINTGAGFGYGINLMGATYRTAAIALPIIGGSIVWGLDASSGIRKSGNSVEAYGNFRMGAGGTIGFDAPTTANANNGSATALPPLPAGYIPVMINGVMHKMPFYNY